MRGFSLLEVMIALGILASMSLGLFMATSQVISSKSQTESRDDVIHGVSLSLGKMVHDLSMAHIVNSKEFWKPGEEGGIHFEGSENRIDFVSFSHLRYIEGAKESDQAELSYYLAPMPDEVGHFLLMRRESPEVDRNLQEGGLAFPLLENVKGIEFEYLDEISGEWKRVWSSQASGGQNRLPSVVRISVMVFLPEEEEQTVFSTLAPIELSAQPLAF